MSYMFVAYKRMESKREHDLEACRQKLRSVVGTFYYFPTEPTQILDHLYIGSEANARDLPLLQGLDITHVINTAESYSQTGADFYGDTMKYMGFGAEDEDDYDIMQHHDTVYAFIEDAHKHGGTCFIHCVNGINRSGALVISYTMVHKHMGAIAATEMVKYKRVSILTNQHFQDQILDFAHQKDLLVLDTDELQ